MDVHVHLPFFRHANLPLLGWMKSTKHQFQQRQPPPQQLQSLLQLQQQQKQQQPQQQQHAQSDVNDDEAMLSLLVNTLTNNHSSNNNFPPQTQLLTSLPGPRPHLVSNSLSTPTSGRPFGLPLLSPSSLLAAMCHVIKETGYGLCSSENFLQNFLMNYPGLNECDIARLIHFMAITHTTNGSYHIRFFLLLIFTEFSVKFLF